MRSAADTHGSHKALNFSATGGNSPSRSFSYGFRRQSGDLEANEVPVEAEPHQVISMGVLLLTHLLAQLGEVGGQDRGRNHDLCLGGPASNSAAGAFIACPSACDSQLDPAKHVDYLSTRLEASTLTALRDAGLVVRAAARRERV